MWDGPFLLDTDGMYFFYLLTYKIFSIVKLQSIWGEGDINSVFFCPHDSLDTTYICLPIGSMRHVVNFKSLKKNRKINAVRRVNSVNQCEWEA